MDGEVDVETGRQVQGGCGALGLVAARGEFYRGVAGVEHVVGIRDDDELKLGWGE